MREEENMLGFSALRSNQCKNRTKKPVVNKKRKQNLDDDDEEKGEEQFRQRLHHAGARTPTKAT